MRLIYLEGSGCYGMNGHEDAAADAAILSRAVGRPVRVQWSREDELGWDPKGPPQLIDISGAVGADGTFLDWRTEMWIPQTTKGLPNIPLLAPEAAGLDDMRGLNPGLISQNGDPPYAADTSRSSRTGSRTRRCVRPRCARPASRPIASPSRASLTSWRPRPGSIRSTFACAA